MWFEARRHFENGQSDQTKIRKNNGLLLCERWERGRRLRRSYFSPATNSSLFRPPQPAAEFRRNGRVSVGFFKFFIVSRMFTLILPLVTAVAVLLPYSSPVHEAAVSTITGDIIVPVHNIGHTEWFVWLYVYTRTICSPSLVRNARDRHANSSKTTVAERPSKRIFAVVVVVRERRSQIVFLLRFRPF